MSVLLLICIACSFVAVSLLRWEQPADQQPRLVECFDKLMADVARNLEPKNRDKFTHNLTLFRHDFRAK